ncbi:MAG TPA: prepilin-type N-terminal cleavage/methylation domain-containing protein [Candidatus Nitrosotenuis sp.]|nr:prepilin-type N-terminal cleavage/methylation domain-containing protein [Candidatus Nitrosotenuis sp.]
MSQGRSRAIFSPRGVTLLEILVAVAILAIGAVTVFQVFPMGFAASAKAKYRSIAYELAQKKLEEVRNAALFGGTTSDPDAYWGDIGAPDPNNSGDDVVVNTDGQWVAFDSPYSNYYYDVECVPVIDPDMNYKEYMFDEENGSGYRGFATMWRITVTVYGPFEQESDMSIPAATRQAVKVQLVTYVANKVLGEAEVVDDIDIDDDHYYDPVSGELIGSYPPSTENRKIWVQKVGAGASTSAVARYPGVHNFTVFTLGNLSNPELMDTGPTRLASDGVSLTGLNVLGLDNVVIYYAKGTPTENATAGGWVAETNKLVDLYAPDDPGNQDTTPVSGGAGDPRNTYWCLVLQRDIYGWDSDFGSENPPAYSVPRNQATDTSITSDSSATATYIMDAYCDDWAYISAGNRGYPAGDTKVRFLLRVMQQSSGSGT